MAATKLAAPNATPALNFDVIDARAAELEIGPGDELADFLEYDRTTVWRWRNGLTKPSFEVVCDVAEKLGLSVADIRPIRDSATPGGGDSTGGSPPAGPQTPPPPSGPKAGE